MKGRLPALFLLLAAQAGAQTFVSMGRLFTTPGERVQLDALRNQASQAAIAAAGMPQGAAGGTGVGLGAGAGANAASGAAAGAGASAGCPPGSAPGCPPALGAAGGAGWAGGPAGLGSGTGASEAAASGAEAQEAPGLQLDGIIRRSHGGTLVIVNGEVQPAPAGGVVHGTVRLQADGRSVVLKPGQRYDPATGEIHEAAR